MKSIGHADGRKVPGQWGRSETDLPLDFFDRRRSVLRTGWGGFLS